MEKQIRQVADFMTLCGQATPMEPTLSSREIRHLRIKLQQEELDEMGSTLSIPDGNDTPNVDAVLIALADDIADQLYILFGTISAFGLQDYIPAVFEAVHNANMTKTHETVEAAVATQNYWRDTRGIESTIQEINGRQCVISLEGKLLKNTAYQEADLGKVFADVKAMEVLLTKDSFVTEAMDEYLDTNEKIEE